jgi:hypothetical protein
MKGNQILFEVEAVDRVVVTKFESWECRGECALELLCDLVQNWPELMVGRSGGISFRDYPPDAEWVDSLDLAFSATKRIGEPSDCLAFPCPYTLRWPQVGIPDAELMMGGLLANEAPFEDDRMFWIGANTHPSRVKLCEIGNSHRDLFDTEIMQWDPRAPGGQRSKTRQVSIPDHARYKYLVDCPGVSGGYSARIKWLLATGRPLFIVDREFVEHWHDDLQPWIHYVPVKADLSDLLDQHARLEADSELYENIGRNARRFAAENLTVEAMLNRSAEAVWLRVRELDAGWERTLANLRDPNHVLPIVAVHTSNMAPLFEDFVTSLSPERHGLRLIAERCDISDFHEFGFQTESWYRMLSLQVQMAIDVMEREVQEGDYFIVSDIDLHFFRPEEIRNLVVEAASARCEFSALIEHPNHYNSGFIILRKGVRVTELYRQTLEGLQTRRSSLGDQDEINRLIHELGIKHCPIPERMGVLGERPLYEEAVFYHATSAIDLKKKLARIDTAKSMMRSRSFGVGQGF